MIDVALFGTGSAWSESGLSSIQPGEFPTPCSVWDSANAARFDTDFTVFSLLTVDPETRGGPAGRRRTNQAERRRLFVALRQSLDALRVRVEADLASSPEVLIDPGEARKRAEAASKAAELIIERAQELSAQAASLGGEGALKLQAEAMALEQLAKERMRREKQLLAALAAAVMFFL